MNGIVKYPVMCLTVLYLSAAVSAWAQTGYYNADERQPPAAPAADSSDAADAAQPSHTVIVTSIEKCYAQLGQAAAVDIETHYEKPYEECQRRLALKIQQQQQLKAGQLKNSGAAPVKGAAEANAPPDAAMSAPLATPASTPDEGFYYRVQKDPLPAAGDR